MKLLVSVAGADDADAALVGGADIIDAKDPYVGALGAVPLPVFRAIQARVGDMRPVSAALGDAHDAASAERAARAYADAGAAFVKLGFARGTPAHVIERAIAAAVRGAGSTCDVIAVAFADTGPLMTTLPRLAARAGAAGVLLDTVDKSGPSLTQLMSPLALRAFVSRGRNAGLRVALAGRLAADDMPIARAAGADIAGVRGAVCAAGRTGRVEAERVRQCALACATFSAFQEAT